jgi:hypothetical protein
LLALAACRILWRMRFLESTDVLQTLIGWTKRGVSLLRAIGPYAAIELLLPGGSLMALALWLVQRKARKDSASLDDATRTITTSR